jgi:hypothetical protein
MSILKGIKLKDDSTVHQLDYEQGIANKPKIVTSWNDLQDKPFHDDLDAREIIVKEVSLVLEEDTSREGQYRINYAKENPLGLSFNEGETLIYIWNDVEYECTTTKIIDDEGISIYKIGNENLSDENSVDTGEPFFIGMLSTNEIGIVQVGIMSIDSNATLEVQRAYKTAQTIDGKYVKDMYYCEECLNEVIPVQNVDFVLESEGYSSGLPLSYTDIQIGDTIVVKWQGVDYTCETVDYGTMMGSPIAIPAIGNIDLFLGGEDNGIPFIIIFDITGVIFGGSPTMVFLDMTTEPNEEVPTITKQIGIQHKGTKINYIPPKYIKEMYYTEDYEETVIINNQTIPFTENTMFEPIGNYIFYEMVELFDLEEGKTYIVDWDGEKYECVCKSAVYNELPLVGIGNMALPQLGEDTGEPFACGIFPTEKATVVFTPSTDATHTISLWKKAGQTIHQIPSKYVDAYTKEEIDAMLGAYVDEVDTLLGGSE